MARTLDPELKAMQAVVDILDDMDMAAALRVLEWARYRVMTPRIGMPTSGFIQTDAPAKYTGAMGEPDND